jgi:SAM-dependent methyltransferase
VIEDQRAFQQSYYDRHYGPRTQVVLDQLAHPLWRSFHDRLAARILDQVPVPASASNGTRLRVFETGCGEGFLGSALLRQAERRALPVDYCGTDLSAAALDLARPALGDNLIVGDASEVAAGLPSASRDLVMMKNLLHHLEDPAGLLREAARIVGPEGRVAVVEARLGCPQFWVFSGLAPRRERYFFKGARRNLRALADAGLRVVHHEQYSFLPYELFLHIRFGVFRRLLSSDDPGFIGRISGADDRLARSLPWLSSYNVYVATPEGR